MKYALYYGMEVVVSTYWRRVFQFSFWPADPNPLKAALSLLFSDFPSILSLQWDNAYALKVNLLTRCLLEQISGLFGSHSRFDILPGLVCSMLRMMPPIMFWCEAIRTCYLFVCDTFII
jgi:hypothetical protein